MNQMLVGLWDVDEHSGENRPHSGSFEGIRCCGASSKGCPPQKLERVDRLAVVDIVAGFRLINEETRLRMTGQVDWRAVPVRTKV